MKKNNENMKKAPRKSRKLQIEPKYYHCSDENSKAVCLKRFRYPYWVTHLDLLHYLSDEYDSCNFALTAGEVLANSELDVDYSPSDEYNEDTPQPLCHSAYSKVKHTCEALVKRGILGKVNSSIECPVSRHILHSTVYYDPCCLDDYLVLECIEFGSAFPDNCCSIPYCPHSVTDADIEK